MEFERLNPLKPLTPIQKETMLYASRLNELFRTKDLARYIYPVYFFIGKVYICKTNRDIWSRDRDFIKDMYGVKNIDKYDFRRRAILTTSSRLKSLMTINCVNQSKSNGEILWSINYLDQ